MKALVLKKPGAPDTLIPQEHSLPSPGPDEVRVKVMAVGLNPVDYKTAQWGWQGKTGQVCAGLFVRKSSGDARRAVAQSAGTRHSSHARKRGL